MNRYRVEEVVGRGGFAAVYRADDLRLGRPVAVKVITLSASDPALRDSLRERFQREARAAAGLPHHPNLVTVHDYGTDAELDLDFLVMELLRGEDLATYLASHGRPPLELALAVLVDAGEGLAVGHRAGLVHRDVKPGNLFLAEPHGGEPFRVCVLDYGIARLREEEQTQSRLTQEGSAPLSPAYASPEQLRGEMDLSPASDVFSLGVVGYQLLTGERPFGAERRHRREGEAEPVRPLRELAPDVPAPVEAVIARALAERPEDRFADAGEMAAALSAAVRATAGEGDATVAAPPVLVAAPTPATSPAALDDDATLIEPPAAGSATAPPPSAMPPVHAAPVREAASPPAPRRRGMAGVLLGLLVLTGLAFGGWMLFAADDDGGTRRGDADAVEVEGSLPSAETGATVVTPPPPTGTAAEGGDASTMPTTGTTGTAALPSGEATVPAPRGNGGTPAQSPQPQPTPGAPPVVRPQPQPQPAQPQPAPQPQPQPAPQPQPQPQPAPQPQPQPQPRPAPPRPQPQPQPQPQPEPAPQPLPPAPQPQPQPQPFPQPLPEPLPPPVIPRPFPAPRDTIRIRPLPGRPIPDAPDAATFR